MRYQWINLTCQMIRRLVPNKKIVATANPERRFFSTLSAQFCLETAIGWAVLPATCQLPANNRKTSLKTTKRKSGALIALPGRDYTADTTTGFFYVTLTTGNQVDMNVKDGLAGIYATVKPEVKTGNCRIISL